MFFTENNIYVVDSSGNKYLIFDRQGKFLCSVPGPTGNTPENPARLTDATRDKKDGRIYVCYSWPDQMAVLDLDQIPTKAETEHRQGKRIHRRTEIIHLHPSAANQDTDRRGNPMIAILKLKLDWIPPFKASAKAIYPFLIHR